ncbi:hypothetical protein KKG45_01295 [bacterium]|nr:hypothetical protein [bacterium]MBU1071862.1 hypothetical protein [bacterium]MBU1675448.1 hypothetical protein [bacterium]
MSVLALLLFFVASASATEEWQQRLPLHVPFSCDNCHEPDAAPTASAPALNAFGLAFDDSGRTWSSYLAGLDSDGDGCTNGAEIGDVDGNGHPDNGVDHESSNPGLAGDCSSASVFEEATWGELKAMFNNR